MTKPLHECTWLVLGSTGQHAKLTKAIGDICRDVAEAGVIDEICIHDIVETFRKHGYVVVPERETVDVPPDSSICPIT